ncbi:MAG: thioredoxin [Elusimicrobia bacterium CG06_land_8_20_14_3_00_38_11]|nr:MAG: thioredoxin [Elusimicrobia bacterium CG06_land_8_20_14_3_00_38_11]
MTQTNVKNYVLLLSVFLFVFGCGKDNDKKTETSNKSAETSVKEVVKTETTNKSAEQVSKDTAKTNMKIPKKQKKEIPEIKVTFVELGSVGCIPCKMMQPVMKEIEEKYKGQVKVVFYDVWTSEGSPYAEKYRIRVIPTQVFLDENGKEFFRHEGFFPKEELVKILELQGVKK